MGVELGRTLRSALSIYLILALVIPPQVWAETIQIVESKKAAAPVAAKPNPAKANRSGFEIPKPRVLEGTPLHQPETKRDEIRFDMHQGSRFIENIVRLRTKLIQRHPVEYHVHLRSYADCTVDQKRLGQDPPALIADIDKNILAPIQQKLAQFFADKGPTMLHLSGGESEDGLKGYSVDALTTEKDLCIPVVWDAEDADAATLVGTESNVKNADAAVKVRKRLEAAQAQGLQYLQPLFLELGRKRADSLPLTNVEVGRWMAWLKGLRDFRNLLATQFGVSEPIPEMILGPGKSGEPGPGARVALNNRRAKENRAVELLEANNMLSATQLSAELPRFVECAKKKEECGVAPAGEFAPGSMCFCDGVGQDDSGLEERIFRDLNPALDKDGKSPPASIGAHVNAERLLALQALLMEFGTVVSLLPGLIKPESVADYLPASVRTAAELAPLMKVFQNFASYRFREWWLQRLHEASRQFGEQVREGKVAVDVPQNPQFYAKANALMQEWVKAVLPSPPVAPEVAKVYGPTLAPAAGTAAAAPTKAATESPAAEGEPAAETPAEEVDEEEAAIMAALAEQENGAKAAAEAPAAESGDKENTEPGEKTDTKDAGKRTEVKAPAVIKPLTPQEQMLQMVATFPFEERILEGTERVENLASGTGRNFAKELGQLVTLWGTLIPWEFEKLSDDEFAKRDGLVGEMMREAYKTALEKVFLGYATAFFQGNEELHQRAVRLWDRRFRAQWQQIVASSRADGPFEQEIKQLAETSSKSLKAMPAFAEKFNPERIAEEALTEYTRKLGPRAREAFIANQVEAFMESHRQKLENPIVGPSNLVPGFFLNPNNYYYQAAQAKNVTEVPACFQVGDGNGHDREWYELFIATMQPGDTLDYVHLKRAIEGMSKTYRPRVIQRITKLLLKTESKLDAATARWVVQHYPSREKSGRTVQEQAVSILNNLPDKEVTLECETQANIVAGKYFKGDSSVGAIADIVIEKFTDTLEAKDKKDRGRTREGRKAALATLEAWLGNPLNRAEFLKQRKDLAIRIYDYHLRLLLESWTPENAKSVAPQLAERLRELGEQKILVDGEDTAGRVLHLVAAQDRHQKALKAGEARGAIHAFWEKYALQDDYFKDWAEKCVKDPVKCQAWFEDASQIFEDPALEAYFNQRIQKVAKDFLPEFLKEYGAGQKEFKGKFTKKNAFNMRELMMNRLLQAWIGFIPQTFDAEEKPVPIPQYDAAKVWIQEFLIEMSKLAKAEGGNDLVLEALPAHVAKLATDHKLFETWKELNKAHRAQIGAAIATKKFEELSKVQQLALQTYFGEVQTLINNSDALTPENARANLIAEVAHILLPGFNRLRDELTGMMKDLFKDEADPMDTLRSSEERLVQLRDLEWDQKEKKTQVDDPHQTWQKEIANLEKNVIPKAKAQIHREMLFARVATTYLPAELVAQLVQGGATDLYVSFLQRQFLDAREDARREAMPFSMAQLLNDLNAVSRKLEAPLQIEAETAKKFVTGVNEYFTGWMSSYPLKQALAHSVNETLAADRAMIPSLPKRDAEMWALLVQAVQHPPDSPEMTRLKDMVENRQIRPAFESVFRLHRIWFMTAGDVKGFSEWMLQSLDQVERSTRVAMHTLGLAALSGADAEAWRLITFAAQSGVTSDAYQQLEKLGDLGKRAQDALFDLNTQWVEIHGDSKGFGEWFAELGRRDGTAKELRDLPLGRNFPRGASYAQLFVSQGKDLASELAKIAAPKGDEKPVLLEGELRAKYTAFARSVSDVLYHPASQLGPLVMAADKILWPQVAPTKDLPISIQRTDSGFGYEFAYQGIDERFVTQSILDVLGRPKMDTAAFSQLVSPFALQQNGIGSIPEFKKMEDKIGWVNSLSMAQRLAVFNGMKFSLLSNVISNPAANASVLAAFEPQGEPTVLGRNEWINQFARELGVWESIHGSFGLDNPPPSAAGAPEAPITGIDSVALALVRSFTDYTNYRLVDGKRWQIIGEAAVKAGQYNDQVATVAAFTQNLKTDRRHAYDQVQAIGRIFNRELQQNPAGASTQPFHELFSAPEKLQQLTPAEVVVRVYSRRFGPDALREKNEDQRLANEWSAQYSVRARQGRDPFERRFVGYFPNWVLGIKSNERKSFEEWVKNLLAHPGAEAAYQEVKAELRGLETRAVEAHATLKELVEGRGYQQVLGLMTVADANTHYKAEEETYPYFVMLLDWNLNEHAADLKPGAPTALPFGDAMRSRFMGELVDVLGIDPKSFSGWESLLKRKATHEHFAAMARSKRAGLVGVSDNRFLSTGVATEWTGRGWWGSKKTYNPIPVVSNSERTLLQMERGKESKVGDFALYAESLKGAEAQAATAMNRDGLANRPVYQNVYALQSQMFGEKDLAEVAVRAQKLLSPEAADIKKRQRTLGAAEKFGSDLIIDGKRAEKVVEALKALGVTPDEVKVVSALAEPYIDFRRQLGEVEGLSIVMQMLQRYLRQIDPHLTDPQVVAIANSINSTTATDIGQVRERALYIASEFTHRKGFHGRSQAIQDRTAKILGAMQDVYQGEMQKAEVKDALGVVLMNSRDLMAKLSDPVNVAELAAVKTKEDLAKSKVQKILKETGIAYATGIRKYLYFDSGLVENGIDSETRRRVDGIVRQISNYRQNMDRAGHAVNWALGIGLFAFVLSKPFPGVGALGRAAMRSSLARYGMIAVTTAMAGYFGWQVVDDIFDPEKFWSGDEMELLKKVAYSSYSGQRSLRRDKDVAALDDKRLHDQVEATTNVPYANWLYRVWLIGLTYTMLAPYLRAAAGGVRYAWYARGNVFVTGEAYAQQRLGFQAWEMGLDVEAFLNAPPLKRKEMIEAAQLNDAMKRTGATRGAEVNGVPGMTEEVFPTQEAARKMRRGIDAEIEQTIAQGYLDPITGRTLTIPELETKGFFGWLERKLSLPKSVGKTANGLVKEATLVNREAQIAAEKRVDFLRKLRGKLEGSAPHYNLDDLNQWLPYGMDMSFTNTPTWIHIAGIPFYRNEVISLVGGLQKYAGKAQAAQRILGVRWALKYRSDEKGLDVFRRAAKALSTDGEVVDPLDLIEAAYTRNHKYRKYFEVTQASTDAEGAVATFGIDAKLQEQLNASASELIQIMEVGGWRPDRKMFQMMLETSSVQGDRELVRKLISDQRSIVLRASGARREKDKGTPGDDGAFKGDSAAMEPSFIDDVDDLYADLPPIVKKPKGPTAGGTVLPPELKVQTDAEVLKYLEQTLAAKRAELGVAQPVGHGARGHVLSVMKFNEPTIAAVVEENGILLLDFTAEDILGAAAQLRSLGKMTPAREEAFQTAAAYLKAFEVHGRSVDFEVAARVYSAVLKVGGQNPLARAVEVYEILYGARPVTQDQAVIFRRWRTLAGDLESLPSSTPITREAAEKNLQALESLVKTYHRGTLPPEHVEALARLKEAREVFVLFPTQAEDMTALLRRVQGFSESAQVSAQDWGLAVRANQAADSVTPPALRGKVYELLEHRMSLETLERAMFSARRNPEVWNSELADVFKYTVAYTRAMELASGDAASVGQIARIYVELFDLVGVDTVAANQMYAGILETGSVRRYGRVFETLALQPSADLKTIHSRIEVLKGKLQTLSAHPDFLASPKAIAKVDAGLKRLGELSDLVSFDAGPDFGFQAAWKALSAATPEAEAGGVIQLFEREVLGAGLSTEQIMERLTRARLKIVEGLASGTMPVGALDAMARASTAIRSRLMLKLAASESGASVESIANAAEGLMELSQTVKLRFPMNVSEAETYFVTLFENRFNVRLDNSQLRNRETVSLLYGEASNRKFPTEEWPVFNRAKEVLETELGKTTYDRTWFRQQGRIELPWEASVNPAVVEDSKLYHFLRGGNEESAKDAQTTLRILLMESPEAKQLEDAMTALVDLHLEHDADLARENFRRTRDRVRAKTAEEHGPSGVQDLVGGINERKTWAAKSGNKVEAEKLERAISRITGQPVPEPGAAETGAAGSSEGALGTAGEAAPTTPPPDSGSGPAPDASPQQ